MHLSNDNKERDSATLYRKQRRGEGGMEGGKEGGGGREGGREGEMEGVVPSSEMEGWMGGNHEQYAALQRTILIRTKTSCFISRTVNRL